MSKYIVTDTCFWIALLDPKDAYFNVATDIYSKIEKFNIIVPWPIMYEVLKEKTIGDKNKVSEFEKLLVKVKPEYRISDEKYKEKALQQAFDHSRKGRHISLVDSIIRELLLDPNVRKEFLVTFNEKDFSDVCKSRIYILGKYFDGTM